MATISQRLVGRTLLIGTLLGAPAALGIGSLRGPAHSAAAAATLTLSLSHLTMPASLPAGTLTVRVLNDTKGDGEASFASLNKGLTEKQALATIADGSDAGFLKTSRSFTFVGGAGSLPSGAQATVTVSMAPGRYAVVNGDARTPVVKFFTVAPNAGGTAAATTPAGAYAVQMADFYFAGLPKALHAGPTTFTTINNGPSLHHMLLIRLDKGKTMADVMKALGSNQQPGWAHNAGGMDLVSPGHSASITLTLVPGRYLVACFVPDLHTHKPHAMEGMSAIITAS